MRATLQVFGAPLSHDSHDANTLHFRAMCLLAGGIAAVLFILPDAEAYVPRAKCQAVSQIIKSLQAGKTASAFCSSYMPITTVTVSVVSCKSRERDQICCFT